MTLADAVSLRSRRHKLRLFFDEMQPTAATTVLDVGADEVGFGSEGGESGCSTHNYFEEHYPWPGQITALGLQDGALFGAAIRTFLCAGRRMRASFPDGDSTWSSRTP